MLYIHITAIDQNGRWLESLHELNKPIYKLITPLINAIKDFKPYWINNEYYCHNYPIIKIDSLEKSREQLYLHTIKEIKLIDVRNSTTILRSSNLQ